MYKSQYEDYYKSLQKKKLRNDGFKYNDYKINNNRFGYSNNMYNKRAVKHRQGYIARRIIRDLSGGIVLFLIVIGLKTVSTPKTQQVYNTCKTVVDVNYNYKDLMALKQKINGNKYLLNTLNLEDIQKRGMIYVEKFTKGLIKTDKIGSIKGEMILPTMGKLTSPYGYRKDPISGIEKFHTGIDIAVSVGSKIKAGYSGVIKECGEDKKGYGKYIVIDHGSGIETKYAHLQSINIKEGKKVKKGDIIGKSGNTGKSTGPHIHFEVLQMGESVDPKLYLNNN